MAESWEGLNFTNPPTPVAALTAVLALNAPGDEESAPAVAVAEELAAGLTPEQVEQAKAAAQEHFDA
jgi:hypothetical protein